EDLADQHRAAQQTALEQQRSDQAVLQALAPVRYPLQHISETVAGLEQQRARQHGELAQQLRSAHASEQQLRHTADTLADALNSNSTRGVWGETQLRRVVEAAGMIERVDFDVQASMTSSA